MVVKDVPVDFCLTAAPFTSHEICTIGLLNNILSLSCLDVEPAPDMNMISFKFKAHLPLLILEFKGRYQLFLS